MKDIESPGLMYFKAALLVLLGILAAGLLIFDHPDLRTIFLLAVSVWAFARAYYFAFYVIEHYIDETYKFAGLLSFVGYLWKRRRSDVKPEEQPGASCEGDSASHAPQESDSIG